MTSVSINSNDIRSGWGALSFGGQSSSVLQEVGRSVSPLCVKIMQFFNKYLGKGQNYISLKKQMSNWSCLWTWWTGRSTCLEKYRLRQELCRGDFTTMIFPKIQCTIVHLVFDVWVKASQMGRKVLETMLCAAEKKKDSCQGDSGGDFHCKILFAYNKFKSWCIWFWVVFSKGPLNCLNPETKSWELCGIVSWGAECADPGEWSSLQIYFSSS